MAKINILDLFSGVGGVSEGTDERLIVQRITNEGRAIKEKLPSNIVIGRDLYLQLPQITENLYDILKDNEIEAEVYKREKKGGCFVLVKSKYPIDLNLFPSFVHAVSKNLSNQSYLSGNLTDERGGILLRGKDLKHSTTSNKFLGNITMSLRSFTQDVHGTKKPNSLQEKQVIGLLRALQDTFVGITEADGKSITTPLCNFSFSKDGDRAPQMLHLTLPPIWCETLKGIGSVPQDIAYRLTNTLGRRKTPTHTKLVNLLGVQDRNKTFKRSIEQLIKDLNLTKYYKGNPKKAETLIVNVCNDLVEQNFIEKVVTKVMKVRGRDRLTGIEIYLKKKG